MVLGEVAQPAAVASEDGERGLPLIGPTLPLQLFFDASACQLGNAALHGGSPPLHFLVSLRLELDLCPNHANIMVLKCQHVNKSGLSFH